MTQTIPQLRVQLIVRAVIYCTLFLFFSQISYAQEESESPSVNDMTLNGKAFDKTPIQKPTIAPVNIKVNWQLWKKVFATGESGADQLKALGQDSHTLGIANQTEYAMAITDKAMKAEPKLAKALFERAQSLAPNLPYPFLADATYFATKEPTNFPDWFPKIATGIKNLIAWPDTHYAWMLKLLTFFLIALSISFLIFTIGQLIRHLPVVVYDATRVMPRGFSNNQSAIVLLAIIVVPGVILRAPLISALLMLAFVSLVQNWGERLISCLIFLTIALIPTFDLMVFEYASFYGSRTQKLARAQYEKCELDCRNDLKILLKVAPKDHMILYTSLLAGYRTGEPEFLQEIVKVNDANWPVEYRGHLQNLKGAAFVALAKPEQAIKSLSKSMTTVESSAPRFNMMRAYQMQDKLDEASNALSLAVDMDIDRVTEYLRYERRDVNSFLIVEPIPLGVFHDYKSNEKNVDGWSPVATVWLKLSGPSLHLSQAVMIGLIGLLFALIGGFLQFRGKTSTPCPRCGLARDPEDTVKTSDHKFCLLCYKTFVMGSGMDYQARVYNEKILGRREWLQMFGRRLLSVIAPGAGHHLAGRALFGFALSFSIVFSILVLMRPAGIVRPPLEYFIDNWLWQTSISWLVLCVGLIVAVYAAVRDIAPVVAKGAK